MVAIWSIKAFYLLMFSFTWKSVNGDCLQTANFSVEQNYKQSDEQFFPLDSEVNLMCFNRTEKQIIYIIWKVKTEASNCCIGWHVNESHIDTCHGRKVLRNRTSGDSYLHIPRFTRQDEGNYTCETSYWGGRYAAKMKVSAIVRPKISSLLEVHGGRREAVCLAAGGKPIASISWNTTESLTENQMATSNHDGTFTVQSRLVLPYNTSNYNLMCIVTHPSLKEPHIEKIFWKEEDAVPWKWIGISLMVVGLIVLTGVCLSWKHFSSILVQHCCKLPNPPATEPQKKRVQYKFEDVEELEPYSSYVQRVNSIYNSSADLCKH